MNIIETKEVEPENIASDFFGIICFILFLSSVISILLKVFKKRKTCLISFIKVSDIWMWINLNWESNARKWKQKVEREKGVCKIGEMKWSEKIKRKCEEKVDGKMDREFEWDGEERK